MGTGIYYQGPFSFFLQINFTAPTGVIIDLTHDNAMLAFQHFFHIYNVTDGCYGVDVQFFVLN
jgi:hypothetical protein